MDDLYLHNLMEAIDDDESIELETWKAVRQAWRLVYEPYFMAKHNLNEATKAGIVFG